MNYIIQLVQVELENLDAFIANQTQTVNEWQARVASEEAVLNEATAKRAELQAFLEANTPEPAPAVAKARTTRKRGSGK